jgi:MazG family protein
MAEEGGHFDFEDVARGITDKLVRRHPHVFGSDEERASGKVAGSWERIKAEERRKLDDDSVLAGIAVALPALKRAEKLGKRASSIGFDWPDGDGVRDKVSEEIDEIAQAVGTGEAAKIEEEVGDLLFTVANLARHLGCDPEHALARANAKFERRFRAMEAEIAAAGQSMQVMSADALEAAWQAAKRRLAEAAVAGGPDGDS